MAKGEAPQAKGDGERDVLNDRGTGIRGTGGTGPTIPGPHDPLDPRTPTRMRTPNTKTRRFLNAALSAVLALQGVLGILAPQTAVAATQNAYRWRNDDGSEAAATWAAAENTALPVLSKGVTKRLRVGANKDSNEEALLRRAALALDIEINLLSGVVDTANGYAYFGTDTSPGRVIKVALGAGAAAPTRTAALALNAGENGLRSAVADAANGYAYFGTDTSPGQVVKVALGAGAAAPARDSALTLAFGENLLSASSIDTANGYAYFGTNTQPGRIVKMSIASRLNIRLAYGLKSSSCAAVTSWTTIPTSISSGQHFQMASSPYFADGATAANNVGLSDGGTNFYYGRLHEAAPGMPNLPFGEAGFSEYEFSITPTANAVTGGSYCFRLTSEWYAFSAYTNYAQAVVSSQQSTTTNSVTLTRLAAGATAGFRLNFALQSPASGLLIVSFPAGFTVTSAAATADSSGCLSGFGFTSSTLTANKTTCSGAVTLGGATVTNPSSPGTYIISWVNDDPGSATVIIVTDDGVTVNANVDPYLTFNVGTQAAATACDGSFSGNGGTLAFGILSAGAVTTSDAATVDHVCTRISTNATGGATVTVKSLNAGLKSTSASADVISSSTVTLIAGTPGYGLCVGSGVGDTGKDTTTPVSASPLASSPFASTCSTSAHNVGGLTVSAQNLWTLATSSQNAFARLFLKAAISATTPAHNDYTDTLTFVASGTY